MSESFDREARQRFAHEMDRNFSVLAAAGSGKTRAITDRIVELAHRPSALERLPQLVVVTYTNRAADEMQQRTRRRILEAGLPLEIIDAFNRAFFGTIHSFCVRLLATYGHHLGLPGDLELITDDEELWNQFVQQHITIGTSLGERNRRTLLRHVQARQLMELARTSPLDLSAIEPDICCPDADFDEVYSVVAKGLSTRTIPKDKANLQRWEARWRETSEFAPLPKRSSNAAGFVKLWRRAFQPMRDWLDTCALCVAAEVQQAYRDFRFERGVVTYADQVALAVELIRQPDVVRRIREKNYRVILDEAQDTDPQQFLVLLEITRPSDASGLWREERRQPPRPGHFCMVGDFQQSIYRDPADLARYRELHEALIEDDAAAELKFSVTFRLDRAQLEFVNRTFPHILNDADGQIQFIELNDRPDILAGQVIRLDLASEVDLEQPELHRAGQEARELANWLRAQGLEKLRAQSWRDVAILSPRKAWLRVLRDALLAVGLSVEVHSEADLRAESPAYAWLTSLLTIMVDPNANYEIVGVLRDIFGLSDDELARFAQADGTRFQIAKRTIGRGTVNHLLNVLAQLRLTIAQQPLFGAVREIIRTTQLRERLRTLPVETFPELEMELDKLLSGAAAAEARGDSLADLARSLRANFNAIREPHATATDAIQLISMHKAKGSEWQAVIIPFLTRKVWGATPRYPSLIQPHPDQGPQLVFDRADVDEFKEALELADRQEMERLLYVALTRARHTLVLAGDPQFFAKANGSIHSHSQMKWLQADVSEPNEEDFAALPGELSRCPQTVSRQELIPRVETYEEFGRCETPSIDSARRCASAFVHTISPSRLVPEEEFAPIDDEIWLEIEPELSPSRIDNPATRYGVWWHDFAQRIPWLQNAATWDSVFAGQQVSSPDRARSAREWRLLRQKINTISDFMIGCENGAPVVRTEMPFFWKMGNDRCLEGVIDLAFFDQMSSEWLIVDWKTNRITRDKIELLRAQYLSQLASYCQVVKQTTKHPVKAALYSTALGEFAYYNASEIAEEWERLENLPPDKFFFESGTHSGERQLFGF